MTDQQVIEALADRMYAQFCDTRGTERWRAGYRPAWALDYAEVAVEYLGIPEDLFDDGSSDAP